ncbi:hypothetical protein [Dehalococcoides mccartyi]|uniref:Uncharacterized protein n=1 Tax=Dehalococcoides mccartyi (strain VS) TaxID=311424 RepID=D2BJF6_DEHMV|nr:hypothetical protein [Dehalococcoides mccartyi]ACZ62456.1 hypothetical protein DhcVS_1357 [Dehalococcoides mccartyi VS]
MMVSDIMQKRFGIMKSGVLVLCVLLALTGNGCTEPDTEKVIPDACPDLGLLVTQADVTDTLDPYGRPIVTGNVFPASAKAIFLVFSLSDDMCCKTLNVRWFQNSQLDPIQIEDNLHAQFPIKLTLRAPAEGFMPGEYHVSIYVDLWERLSLPFVII